MTCKYLLHFVHEHISFRWPEFLALTSKNNCNFKLLSSYDHLRTRPYIIIELDNDDLEEKNLIKCVKGSYLLKDVYELWAHSQLSVDDLAEQASLSRQFKSKRYAGPNQAFRVNCESFGSKTNQSTKIEWIKKMTFLETFDCGVNLTKPNQIYCIFEMNDRKRFRDEPIKEYYFGRHVAEGDRSVIPIYSLKTRKFIANTTMDPMLSLIAANCAKVMPNDLVYDPFVGSGSLLIAAAHMGAFVFGSDIDWLLLHGKSRPSRKGQEKRQADESIRSNMEQYKLLDRYLDVLISDITKSPLRSDLKIDSIISDPPYGIRECSEKIGKRRETKKVKEYKVRYPSKISYGMNELLEDLLSLAARHLRVGGRLIYYLPVLASDDSFENSIPRHPCLNLESYSEQSLVGKNYRLMVVMEKQREPEDGDEVYVPKTIDGVRFRESYFNKSLT